MVRPFDELFPGLRASGYHVTSPADDMYNCTAWAAGATTRWWWPFGDPQTTYWPEGVPREETLEAFRQAFATLGYAACADAEVELGYEKIGHGSKSGATAVSAVLDVPHGCVSRA